MHTQKHVPRPITFFLYGYKIHVLCSGPVDSKLCIEPVPGIKLENCSVPECKEYWWEGPWQVLCIEPVPGIKLENCSVPECKEYWWEGPWQSCNSCNSYHERSVMCIGENMEALPDKRCPLLSRPISTEHCSLSESCRIQSQNFPGSDETNKNMARDSDLQIPSLDFELDLKNVSMTAWSNCSLDCENGIKKRQINCEGIACNSRLAIEVLASCNLGHCGDWRVGNWSKCSHLCGNGTMIRDVVCDDQCDPNSKPATETICNEGPCVYWWVGPWSPCSSSCGPGIRQRLVECRQTLTENNSLLCSFQNKPQINEPCSNQPDCEFTCKDTLPSSRCNRLKFLCASQITFTRLCCSTCYNKIKAEKKGILFKKL
ncbi:A disintegrin and metalloproteinase with thrombospondin motifs 20 isoform X3 [Eurytemora carolleeae]|uniref:A disintegrin and metalloproteinase with thrombospondin motifs 20 isoform X3 n=1 Tax=Eurytemora carolleeae TaxID=1294199 RepID=UPI000C772747|nr:A disintegrin and metalloproteinase with thrombospondin motifs 20 isoform X3 [Eurytemora carolleeae]|eukprot:XP_023331224.1 A disintegrin and metalloproteinase with thrombospondin motifs 20-like isoform X3 [Eurytemora affinis]